MNRCIHEELRMVVSSLMLILLWWPSCHWCHYSWRMDDKTEGRDAISHT